MKNPFFLTDTGRILMLSMRPDGPGRNWMGLAKELGQERLDVGGIRVCRQSGTIWVAFRTWGRRGWMVAQVMEQIKWGVSGGKWTLWISVDLMFQADHSSTDSNCLDTSHDTLPCLLSLHIEENKPALQSIFPLVQSGGFCNGSVSYSSFSDLSRC